MRTSDVGEMRGEAGLAAKLEEEAAAWRKSRVPRTKFSTAGVQVVRIPKRRIASEAVNGRSGRP
jgi:hypothetical protein